MEIPSEMRERLMASLGVSSEEISAAITSVTESAKTPKVTPFVSYINQMIDTFKADEQALTEFSKCKNIQDRIRLVYGKLSVHPAHRNIAHLFPGHAAEARDASQSKERRDQGNKLYAKGEYEKAIDKYTEAMVVSPVTISRDRVSSREMSLALGNRSAVFLHIGNHEKECLSDIEAAFWLGFPEELAYKLHQRQGQCYLNLGQMYEAQEAFEMASQTVALSSLKANAKLDFKLDLKKALENKDERQEIKAVLQLEKGHRQTSPSVFEPEDNNAKLSRNAEFRNFAVNPSRGAVAVQDIRGGEILLIDDPVSWYLVGNRAATNCHHCCMPLKYALIPSPFVADAVFCGISCAIYATKSYHRFEAEFNLRNVFELSPIDQLKKKASKKPDQSSSTMLLTIRSFLMLISHPDGVTNDDDVVGSKATKGDDDGLNKAFSQSPFASMVSQKHLRDEEDILLGLVVKTVFLVQMFQLSNILGGDPIKKKGGHLGALEMKAALILYKIQRVLPYNTVSIDQVEDIVMPGKPVRLLTIGSAVYSHQFKHSCDPNLLSVCHGNRLILVSKRFIRQGEELCANYDGVHYASVARIARRARLQQCYDFKCTCPACKSDYPLMKDLPVDLGNQNKNRKLKKLLERIRQEFVDNKRLDESLKTCFECLDWLAAEDQLVYPHKAVEAAGHALTCVVWALYGNCINLFEIDG